MTNKLEKYLPVDIPFKGFQDNLVDSGPVEHLADHDLELVNAMLPWTCFTADSQGRRFGQAARKGKRDTPQVIPDKRIIRMAKEFDMGNGRVLEVGCYEGIHTAALCMNAAKVYAIDSRIENVIKTTVRCNLLGFQPTVKVCNLELDEHVKQLPQVEFIHHVGVLYHISNPVKHLLDLAGFADQGIMLDTHYATEEMAKDSYELEGNEYRYYRYGEFGRKDVFSGMEDHSKWLLKNQILNILDNAGFSEIKVINDEQQRNGPRVTLFASKK